MEEVSKCDRCDNFATLHITESEDDICTSREYHFCEQHALEHLAGDEEPPLQLNDSDSSN